MRIHLGRTAVSLVLTFSLSPLMAQTPPLPAAAPADLNLGGYPVLRLHGSAGGLSPEQRIDVIMERLTPLLGVPNIQPLRCRRLSAVSDQPGEPLPGHLRPGPAAHYRGSGHSQSRRQRQNAAGNGCGVGQTASAGPATRQLASAQCPGAENPEQPASYSHA